MNISKAIRNRILKDDEFRLHTALKLRVSEKNVRYLAKTNSDNLTKYAAVKYFFSCGYTEEQTFEPVKLK